MAGAASPEQRLGSLRFANPTAADLVGIADIGKACFVANDWTVARTGGPNPQAEHPRAPGSWVRSARPASGSAATRRLRGPRDDGPVCRHLRPCACTWWSRSRPWVRLFSDGRMTGAAGAGLIRATPARWF